MLYRSGFKYGIPGYRKAAAYPYEVVRFSLDKAFARTEVDKTHFRPWLQAFRDYAFDRRAYGAEEIRSQIRAAEEFGSDGWMLWNPTTYIQALVFALNSPGSIREEPADVLTGIERQHFARYPFGFRQSPAGYCLLEFGNQPCADAEFFEPHAH